MEISMQIAKKFAKESPINEINKTTKGFLDDKLELARAIGIFMVVVGHSSVPWSIEKLLYSFHMPFFYFLSGHLFKYRNIKKIFFSKFKSLMIPYFIVGVLSILLIDIMLTTQNSSGFALMGQYMQDLFMASRPDNLKFNRPLWFLPSLFSLFIIISLFLFFLGELTTFIAITLASVGYAIFLFAKWHGSIPLGIDTAFVASLFFVVGMIAKKKSSFFNNNALVLFLLTFVFWFTLRWLDRSNYYVLAYAKTYPLLFFYLSGLLGALWLFLLPAAFDKILSKKTSDLLFACTTKIRSHLFIIYLFHYPVMESYKYFTSDGSPHWIALAIIGFCVPIMINFFFCRFIPNVMNIITGGRILDDTVEKKLRG